MVPTNLLGMNNYSPFGMFISETRESNYQFSSRNGFCGASVSASDRNVAKLPRP